MDRFRGGTTKHIKSDQSMSWTDHTSPELGAGEGGATWGWQRRLPELTFDLTDVGVQGKEMERRKGVWFVSH